MTAPSKSVLRYLQFNVDWGLLAAVLIALPALLPLLAHAGLPNTADGPAHLMRQVELNQAWAEGNFYPRWGADLAFGHGMPIFSYAPPFLYQLTQLFHLSGLPLDEAMKGVVALDFVLYSVGMFLFARRVFGGYPALVAAAVYVYAPYRLREATIQGNYGQFSGLAFYPLIFWAFHGLITDGRARYRLAAPLALAGLLFSHNISFMLFAPLFAAYLLILMGLAAPRLQISAVLSPLIRTVAAGALGLGLSAIFWLPAFGERHDIKLEGITQGFFDFRENFIGLAEFVSPPKLLDLSAINPEFPLALGLPQLIGAAGGLIALAVLAWNLARRQPANDDSPFTIRRSSFVHTLFFAAFLLLYAFLALPASQAVWEAIPLLALAEFPWRMLGPAVFCTAMLSAAGIWTLIKFWLARYAKFVSQTVALFAVLMTLGLNLPYLYPSQFIPWSTPTPADAFAYEVTSGAIGTTSTGEFLPRWAQQHPAPDTLWPDYEAGQLPQLLDPAGLPAGASAQTSSRRSESGTLHVSSPQNFTATLRLLYWPGWQLYLDDQLWPFSVTEKTGLILAEIPAGEHTLQLRLEATPLRAAGKWLSLFSVVLLALFIFIPRAPQPDFTAVSPSATAVSPKFFAVFAVAIIGLFGLTRPLESQFVLRSDPDHPLPASQSLYVDFGRQLRLVGAGTWPAAVPLDPNGETHLPVVLYWRAPQNADANYSVFLHLDAPNGQTFATADEASPENIPTRNWPPGLYLRNPLSLRLPANLPPIRYMLTAGVYNSQSGERLPLDNGDTAFALGPVWLTHPANDAPTAPPPVASFGPDIRLLNADWDGKQVRLVWQTDQPITQNLSIFVHALDKPGNVLGQSDGAPFDGLYPPAHWLPDQPIEDVRPLALDAPPAAFAVGVYDPATGARLPARDTAGQPLPDNRFLFEVQP